MVGVTVDEGPKVDEVSGIFRGRRSPRRLFYPAHDADFLTRNVSRLRRRDLLVLPGLIQMISPTSDMSIVSQQ